MKPHLENIDFDLENRIKESTLNIPSWTHVPQKKIIFYIAKGKKSKTAEDVFRSNFNEIKEKFPNDHCIYMDGSKTRDAVAAAALTPMHRISEA